MQPLPTCDSEALARLVHAAAARDERAWEALYARFTPTIRAAARGFRLCPADVDDVVQQTWLAALRRIGALERPEAIGAWLLVTARRQALRTLQRGAREVLTDELPVLKALLRTPDASYLDLSERLSMPVGSIGPTRERALDRLRSDKSFSTTVTDAVA